MQTTNYKTVRNDMRTLLKDARDLFREATSTTGERAEDLRNKGIQLLDVAVERAQEMQAVALESSREVAQNTDQYVRANPWRAVAVSAGVGLVFGMLFSSRR
ncbi:Membrane-anchored ribosome-binding protein, inhibits growth in stationary phase, ElaB/YqjD/DUF883 family [Noviherbaspirillum humi]|uniref:Membrane-anchored ribosome-binding protein, inhibits growth in stationary phase, ElaB/YqjD/DUF883 family n=1 Tax=Noviherbaspirillum humi TaxID=1688639 RepID=A0A239BXK6_9BURK|nr:DUF883 family protein [Noviherbaspirillum humi]SNS12148.1 Membrane-anchored ribosome-binding protein, inhibits growth in stationary phase, ElaB/YqjD/DUF883 family [Noviherbaspirillum humi]